MKKLMKKMIILLTIATLLAVNLTACGDSDSSSSVSSFDSKAVIEKLQQFMSVQKDGDKYVFDDGAGCTIEYTDVNEALVFYEPAVYDCFSGAFGLDDIGNDGEFAYDLDEGEMLMYFSNVEVDEGNISIVTYNIDKDEFTINMNAKRYSASDEFADYINEYGLVDIMQMDIDAFKEELKTNGLTFGDIANLKYNAIQKYMG